MPNTIILDSFTDFDEETALNIYLFGEKTTPTNFSDRIRDIPAGQDGTDVQIDMHDYMSIGGGHYATPALAPIVQAFFDTNRQIADGTYSLNGMISQFLLSDLSKDFSISQYTTDITSSDYATRAFLFGTTDFTVKDATFHVQNGIRTIDSIEIIAKQDNLDFHSQDPLASAANQILKPVIDPYDIGRKVTITWTGTGTIKTDYDIYDFNNDQTNFSSLTYSSTDSTAMIGAVSVPFLAWLSSTPELNYLHDGTEVIYGSRESDNLHPETIDYNPYILIAGQGTDTIVGGLGKDTIYGGDGSDSIWGDQVIGSEGGNDELHGENGNDTILGGLSYDTIVGGDGNDLLQGNYGPDILIADAGDDILVGTTASINSNGTINVSTLAADGYSNSLLGGTGYDRYYVEQGVHWEPTVNLADHRQNIQYINDIDGLGEVFIGNMGETTKGIKWVETSFGYKDLRENSDYCLIRDGNFLYFTLGDNQDGRYGESFIYYYVDDFSNVPQGRTGGTAAARSSETTNGDFLGLTFTNKLHQSPGNSLCRHSWRNIRQGFPARVCRKRFP